MAKTKDAPSTATKAKEAPSLPKVSSPPSAGVMMAYRAVKVVAILAGLVATMLSLMACVGAITENGYARFFIALVVTFAVPLFVGDRLLPEDDPTRAKGIITETMAVTWVLFGFVFATVANVGTRGLLTREADRLRKDGWESTASVAYFFAGVQAILPPPAPKPDPSSSASASSTATSTASLAASDSASGSSSAAPTTTATAAPPKSDKADKTPAELFKELSPAVVTIFVHATSGDGSGTGFIIDKQGTIVTNHHVIEDATAVKIKLINGASYTTAELLTDEDKVDLALLRVAFDKPSEGAAPEVTPVSLGDSDAIVVGERAIAIGKPLGLDHTLTDGLVSARRMYEGRAWIQMSVPISPGNSGGPLFNMRGEVIGINTAQISAGGGRAQNLNLAVPVNELKKLIRPDYPDKKKIGGGAGSSIGQW